MQRESINIREAKREEERRLSQAVIDNHFNSIIKRNTQRTNIALLRLEPINMGSSTNKSRRDRDSS